MTLSFGIPLSAIFTYFGSLATPILLYPRKLAAANVDPLPANGSSTTPSPNGSAARTSLRIKSCGFSDGCGATLRSTFKVGREGITSPNGGSFDGRRKPPVLYLRRLSWTRPSIGRRSTTHGSNIDRGLTLTT